MEKHNGFRAGATPRSGDRHQPLQAVVLLLYSFDVLLLYSI